MSAQHTQEPWPEFKRVHNPRFGEPPQMMLDETDYNRARSCVNACAGITDKDLSALNGTTILQKANHSVDVLQQQNAELLAALQSLLDVAYMCDSWESFPSDATEAAERAIAKAGAV